MREGWCLKMIALGCGDSKVGIFDWQQLGTQATGDTPDNQTSPASTASCPRSHSRSSETRCGEWHVWNRGQTGEVLASDYIYRVSRGGGRIWVRERPGVLSEWHQLPGGEGGGLRALWVYASTYIRARNEADKWYCIKLLHFSTKY